MRHIVRLPPPLAVQFAEGDLVARPAAVARELLENAVDAGATAITLAICQAGKALLTVRDNGCGIERGELALAVEAGTTSKLTGAAELQGVSTLGFRGMALSAIAAVARLSITSRPPAQEEGACLTCPGADLPPCLTSCSCEPGTTVEVRDLFYNAPARLRLLKAHRTELAHIREVFARLALCHAAISWTFISEGRKILELPAALSTAARRERLARLWGIDAAQAYPVTLSTAQLQLEGFVLAPCPRPVADRIYLAINGRPVSEPQLLTGLRMAWIRCGYPDSAVRCVLELTMDPGAVDVTLHPCKSEVCIHEVREVDQAVQQAVSAALTQQSPAASLGGARAEPGAYGTQQQTLQSWATALLSPGAELQTVQRDSDIEAASAQPGAAAAPAGGEDITAMLMHPADLPSCAARTQAGQQARDGEHLFCGDPACPALRLLSMVGSQVLLVSHAQRFYLIHAALLASYVRAQRYQADFAAQRIVSVQLEQRCRVPVGDRQLLGRISGLAVDTLQRMGFQYAVDEEGVEVRCVPQIMYPGSVRQLQEFWSQAALNAERLEQGVCSTDLALIICRLEPFRGMDEAHAARLLAAVRDIEGLLRLPGVCSEIDLCTMACKLFNL